MREEERRALCLAALRAPTEDAFLALVERAFANDPQRSWGSALAAALFGRAAALPAGLAAEGEDAPFAALMAAVLRRREAAAGAEWPAVLEIGPELDFLQHRCRATRLSLVQFCCLALQARRVPAGRVAAVTMARDEGVYLPEWLAHARLVGVERVFVYSNDNGDGSDALLEAMAAAGLIVLVRSRLAPGVNPQPKAYQHALLLLDELREYRWAAFIDADEFLCFDAPVPGQLPGFLAEAERCWPQEDLLAVFLPWRWRLTDRAFARHGVAVLPEYAFGFDRAEGKSVVRLAAVDGMCAVHAPEYPPGLVVDGMLRPFEAARFDAGVERPYAGPVVEHYWSKSFVEYVAKKRRGDALGLEGGAFRRGWEEFFLWTAPLLEQYRRPIDPAWLARVAAETAAILARPGVGAAYEEVMRRHRRRMDAALEDGALFALYREHLARVRPGFR